MRKAQSSMEFIILFGFVLFMFTTMFVAIKASTSDKIKERQDVAVKEVAITIQDEINLAQDSIDGYYREFDIPDKVAGLEYEAEVFEGLVYVHTLDERHAIALPVTDVVGDIDMETPNYLQIIRKEDGVVYLNS